MVVLTRVTHVQPPAVARGVPDVAGVEPLHRPDLQAVGAGHRLVLVGEPLQICTGPTILRLVVLPGEHR